MSNPEARRGRSSLTLDRNCERYLGGHRLTKAHCSHLVCQRTSWERGTVHAHGASEESGHIYNHAGVDALDDVRAVVASFGAPIAFRKLYGILNAMEMHVEETPYSVEALQHLGKAIEATARLYQVDQQGQTRLDRAVTAFLRKVERQ